jgi:alkylation response protein AidB-like acyl-CoA dehydrogenase
LAAAVIGGGKGVISLATQYANERKQFGQPLSNFGAIKQKLARMATYTFATESACYRTSQAIDDNIASLLEAGVPEAEAKLKGVEQFAIECAIMKVFGSETLDYVVDEGVQIYGGMGYSAEAPMERAYRDSRIARIYEGTNEINRMLLVGMVIKRAMKGELDVMSAAMAVGKELTSVPDFAGEDLSAFFAKEKSVLKNLKKAVLMVAGKAAQQLGPQLNDEQEILMNIADMMMYIYIAETTLLRAEKLVSMRGTEASRQQINMAQVFLYEAVEKVSAQGREAIASFVIGDEQKMMIMGLKRFTKTEVVNIKELRRQIADTLIANNAYAF